MNFFLRKHRATNKSATRGVVTTLTRTLSCLEAFGYQVTVFSPWGRITVSCPSYPEIRLALLSGFSVGRELVARRRHGALARDRGVGDHAPKSLNS